MGRARLPHSFLQRVSVPSGRQGAHSRPPPSPNRYALIPAPAEVLRRMAGPPWRLARFLEVELFTVLALVGLSAVAAWSGPNQCLTLSPIHEAVRSADIGLVKALLADGTEQLHHVECLRQTTALHEAVELGHVEVAEVLLETGANRDALWWIGKRTPLIIAAMRGHTRLVEVLLERGARLDATTAYGWSALHWASHEGHAGAVKALLAAGADPNLSNPFKETALHLAAFRGHEGVVRSLLQYAADVHARDWMGYSSFVWAAERGHGDVAAVLAAHASEQQEDGSRRLDLERALFVAATKGHTRVVEVVVQAGVDANHRNEKKESALHWAAAGGHAEVVRLLVQSGGAAVDGRDGQGATALHAAASEGRVAAVETLLSLGADPGLRAASDNRTVLERAARSGHHEVMEILRSCRQTET